MQPLVYIDTSAMRAGKLEDLKRAIYHLAAFVEAHVPQQLSYGFFLNRAEAQMTVVAVHPDSASLASHLDVGGLEFRKFADLIDLGRIDVYGRISESVRDRLHQKARMLGRGTVAVPACDAGGAR
jgi:arginine/ornithine N-succinyltransferase beta subunit